MSLLHVVIPVYNAKKYLKETVYSVLDQPFKGIDIVLVDDGSADGSGELCDELAAREERIAVIHQKNAGVSAARNAGIEYFLKMGISEGYIAFLDADDLWCPNTFTSSLVEKIYDTNADIMGFSMYSSNPEATKLGAFSSYENRIVEFDKKYQTEILWAKGSFAAHLYGINLFISDHIRFDEDCRYNEDVIFSAKCLFCARKIAFTNTYLYIYRRNRASATSTHRYDMKNAHQIPNAWYAAASFANGCTEINDEAKEQWVRFCITTSSVRCLEMIRCLAEEGYSLKKIEDTFREFEYYKLIDDLQPKDLASWQQQDLILYKESQIDFVKKYKRIGTVKRMIKKTPFVGFIQNIREKKRYTVPFRDIVNN